jgi:hypothetical protein
MRRANHGYARQIPTRRDTIAADYRTAIQLRQFAPKASDYIDSPLSAGHSNDWFGFRWIPGHRLGGYSAMRRSAAVHFEPSRLVGAVNEEFQHAMFLPELASRSQSSRI